MFRSTTVHAWVSFLLGTRARQAHRKHGCRRRERQFVLQLSTGCRTRIDMGRAQGADRNRRTGRISFTVSRIRIMNRIVSTPHQRYVRFRCQSKREPGDLLRRSGQQWLGECELHQPHHCLPLPPRTGMSSYGRSRSGNLGGYQTALP